MRFVFTLFIVNMLAHELIRLKNENWKNQSFKCARFNGCRDKNADNRKNESESNGIWNQMSSPIFGLFHKNRVYSDNFMCLPAVETSGFLFDS